VSLIELFLFLSNPLTDTDGSEFFILTHYQENCI